MLRPRAVREMLVEIAGVRVAGAAEDEGAASAPEDLAEAVRESERHALDRARRRAAVTILVDALAIVVLLVLRDEERFLTLGRNEDTIFTLGVLVIAVHLGFRLAQLLALGTLRRLHDELGERES